ncbi:MAG: hypothetical protein K2W96_07985, partial [Gemmataceae bacterium]|nr:hypothetical protein [Gemmataceae bacterium]
MSFWQRLFGFGGGTAPDDPSNQAAPFSWNEDLDGGKLRVAVTRHALGLAGQSFPCWTYATRGLAAAGQKEIVLTLRCEKGEKEFPRDPLPLFVQFLRLAEQGRTLDEGDYACFQVPGGFLGTTEQTGLACIRAERLPDVEIPADALHAVLLTTEEAEIVPVIGAYRVTALLGRAARFFPCPPWSERGRASVLTRADMDASLLRKMPLAVYPGATARLAMVPQPPAEGLADRTATVEGGRLVLRLPMPQPEGFRDTVASLGEEWSLAFLLKADPLADVRLVWCPGQEGQTITAAGSDARLMTGGF